MRSLDDIITENALRLYRARRAAWIIMRKPEYNTFRLAEEMAPHMPEDGRSDTREKEIARIQRTISRYLGISPEPKTRWRVDYLDAFCRVMGIAPPKMLRPLATGDEASRWDAELAAVEAKELAR